MFQSNLLRKRKNLAKLYQKYCCLPTPGLCSQNTMLTIFANIWIVHLKCSNQLFILNWSLFRSGSSFAGELLSALPGAAYYYEPLFSLRPNGTSIETVIIKDPTQSNLIRQRIMGIFNCSWSLLQTLNKSSFKTVRKRGMSCRRSNPRVIKTIRLRRAGLESWILQDTSVKIVHLVRDPRAMISSISKRPGTWSDTLKNASYQCNRMLDDSKLEDILPHHRFNIFIFICLHSTESFLLFLQIHSSQVWRPGWSYK